MEFIKQRVPLLGRLVLQLEACRAAAINSGLYRYAAHSARTLAWGSFL
jgi:hypothetical protein